MAPRLIAREDEDVSQAVQEILAAEGIEVRLNAECLSVQKEAQRSVASARLQGRRARAVERHASAARGRAACRTPTTSAWTRRALPTDERGYIKVDDELRTSNPGVWALGDCNGKGAFTHTSYNDYEIVADNLLSNAGRKRDAIAIPVYALYTDPPLGRVGHDRGRDPAKPACARWSASGR